MSFHRKLRDKLMERRASVEAVEPHFSELFNTLQSEISQNAEPIPSEKLCQYMNLLKGRELDPFEVTSSMDGADTIGFTEHLLIFYFFQNLNARIYDRTNQTKANALFKEFIGEYSFEWMLNQAQFDLNELRKVDIKEEKKFDSLRNELRAINTQLPNRFWGAGNIMSALNLLQEVDIIHEKNKGEDKWGLAIEQLTRQACKHLLLAKKLIAWDASEKVFEFLIKDKKLKPYLSGNTPELKKMIEALPDDRDKLIESLIQNIKEKVTPEIYFALTKEVDGMLEKIVNPITSVDVETTFLKSTKTSHLAEKANSVAKPDLKNK